MMYRSVPKGGAFFFEPQNTQNYRNGMECE